MYSFRKWIFKPKKNDKSLLAQFFYADEELNAVAAELDSFDGRKDPERCTSLVTQLRHCQDKVLSRVEQIMCDVIEDHRAPRDFRVKFPDDVMQDSLAGQLWFGAECLAAGSSIMNREVESASMRPLAKSLTRHLDFLRSIMRDQCFKNLDNYTDEIREALKVFDKLFAEFELSYVSAMVPVKTMKDYDLLQEVIVLFCETLDRALKRKLLTQDMIDDYDPALMFTIPRLAIVSGLLVYPEGPLNPDMEPINMSEMFRPFQTLLYKIRELLWTLTEEELWVLEKALCSTSEPGSLLSELETSTKVDRKEKQLVAVMRLCSQEDKPGNLSNAKNMVDLLDVDKSMSNSPSTVTITSKSVASGEISTSELDTPGCSSSTTTSSQDSIDQELSETNESLSELPFVSPDQARSPRRSRNFSVDMSFLGALCSREVPVRTLRHSRSMPELSAVLTSEAQISTSVTIDPQIMCPQFRYNSDTLASPSSDYDSSSELNNIDNTLSSSASSPDKISPDEGHQVHSDSSDTSGQPSQVAFVTDALNAIFVTDVASDVKVVSCDTPHCDNNPDICSCNNSPCNDSPCKCTKSPCNTSPCKKSSCNNSCDNNNAHNAAASRQDSSASMTIETVASLAASSSNSSQRPSSLCLNKDNKQQSGIKSRSPCVGAHRRVCDIVNYECESGNTSDTSSYTSECQDDEEIALAIQAAEMAARKEARSRFKNSSDLIHRLFVCISGVADQLQTNYAGDLRHILKSVFECYSSDTMIEPPPGEQGGNEGTGGEDMENREEEEPEEEHETGEEVGRETGEENNEGERNETHRTTIEAPQWVPDEESPICSACSAPFSFVKRRHHCRNCGKVFCGKCSSNSVPLPHYGHSKPVRVCNRCFLYQVTPFTVTTGSQ